MRILLVSACAAILTVSGCVERRSSPDPITTHPPEWNQTTSADFHGTRVEQEGVANCVACHGTHLEGANGVPSCNDCHDGAGGHPGGWADVASPDFHGDVVARDGLTECAACHAVTQEGALQFTGGWTAVSCYDCHAGGPSGHPDGWMDPHSADFHGTKVFTEGVDDCTRCHGLGLAGGTCGGSCGECHN